MQLPASFHAIRAAVTALRERTGVNYGTAVERGRFQLQVVTYGPKRRAIVQPVTGWTDADGIITAANAL